MAFLLFQGQQNLPRQLAEGHHQAGWVSAQLPPVAQRLSGALLQDQAGLQQLLPDDQCDQPTDQVKSSTRFLVSAFYPALFKTTFCYVA